MQCSTFPFFHVDVCFHQEHVPSENGKLFTGERKLSKESVKKLTVSCRNAYEDDECEQPRRKPEPKTKAERQTPSPHEEKREKMPQSPYQPPVPTTKLSKVSFIFLFSTGHCIYVFDYFLSYGCIKILSETKRPVQVVARGTENGNLSRMLSVISRCVLFYCNYVQLSQAYRGSTQAAYFNSDPSYT